VAGLFLPTAAQPFCDCWKRSEELVQNTPDIPVVIVNTVQGEVDKKGERTACSTQQQSCLQLGAAVSTGGSKPGNSHLDGCSS
jgi:hypothetical protein